MFVPFGRRQSPASVNFVFYPEEVIFGQIPILFLNLSILIWEFGDDMKILAMIRSITFSSARYHNTAMSAPSQEAYKADLIKHAMSVDALKFGSFTLKSGRCVRLYECSRLLR